MDDGVIISVTTEASVSCKRPVSQIVEKRTMAETYLSDQQVARRYGVHRSTIWRWVKTDTDFPRPIVLSLGCTRWKLGEVEAWEARRASQA